MAFRINKSARDQWFKDISNEFSIDFDIYYLCLLPGIVSRRKLELPNSQTVELIRGFPDLYREQSRIIVSLFLDAELNELGIDFTNKGEVHKAIGSYVNATSQTYLTATGEEQLNQYAHGGFELIASWFDDRPRWFLNFVKTYREQLSKLEGL